MPFPTIPRGRLFLKNLQPDQVQEWTSVCSNEEALWDAVSPVKTYSLFSRTPILEKQIDAKQRVLKEKKVKRQENRSKKSNVWTCQDRDGLKSAVWGEGMGRGEAGVAGKETQQGVPTSRCLTYCHIEVPPSPTLCWSSRIFKLSHFEELIQLPSQK